MNSRAVYSTKNARGPAPPRPAELSVRLSIAPLTLGCPQTLAISSSRMSVVLSAKGAAGKERVIKKSPPPPSDEVHVPVLLNEISDLFKDVRMRVYVDGTLGAAGHASAIARDHPELEILVGIDQDPAALQIASERLTAVERERVESAASASTPTAATTALQVRLHRGNFKELGPVLRNLGLFGEVDGLLLDLGMSSIQLDSADRGFSFKFDAPLDMRMNPEGSLTAEGIVNTWTESEIARIIREYGEDNQARLIARKICEYREEKPISTVFQLLDAMQCRFLPRGWKGAHPATRTFQALRIAVNDELGVLRDVLPDALNCLSPGGRLGIISFHSLEDRMVKRSFAKACGRIVDDEDSEDQDGPSTSSKSGSRSRSVSTAAIPKEAPPATHKLVVRKPISASEAELAMNSRARSAKYRIVEKLGGEPRSQEGASLSAAGEKQQAQGEAPAFVSKYALKKAKQQALAQPQPAQILKKGGGDSSGKQQRKD